MLLVWRPLTIELIFWNDFWAHEFLLTIWLCKIIWKFDIFQVDNWIIYMVCNLQISQSGNFLFSHTPNIWLGQSKKPNFLQSYFPFLSKVFGLGFANGIFKHFVTKLDSHSLAYYKAHRETHKWKMHVPLKDYLGKHHPQYQSRSLAI